MVSLNTDNERLSILDQGSLTLDLTPPSLHSEVDVYIEPAVNTKTYDNRLEADCPMVRFQGRRKGARAVACLAVRPVEKSGSQRCRQLSIGEPRAVRPPPM